MESLNIAHFFLDARIEEGRGDRVALHTGAGRRTYREVQALANRYANVLSAAGVAPEQRVITRWSRSGRMCREVWLRSSAHAPHSIRSSARSRPEPWWRRSTTSWVPASGVIGRS